MAYLHPERVDELLVRVRREVEEGLLPSCQLALGYRGHLVVNATMGSAASDSRYCIFSATKPFVASTVWQLLAEGALTLETRVADLIDGFGANGKDAITVEQVMLHTSGFPHAPLGPPAWFDRRGRQERMAAWRLNHPPGEVFEYHATSAHWVLAELVETVTGHDYRDEVERRVTAPLGLPRILGIPADAQAGIRDLVVVGEHATPDELEDAFGMRELPATEVTDDAVQAFNLPEVRELGVPGGGGFARAQDLALFYQHLLHDPTGLWDPEWRRRGTAEVVNRLPDPMGVPANRALGLILAGNDGLSHVRGFGRTVSPATFGHNGAGGQLAWADPVSGLSLAYLTDGYDVHEVRQPRRGTAISSLAANCVVD